MMVGDAQNEVVRFMPSNRIGATVPAVRREGGLAIAVTAVGALALGAVAVGTLAIGKTAIVAMRGSPLSSELRKAQPPCREHRGT